ncbi:hypothetical protein [Campylobacter corcagiensis]|uniref:Uncharacterized protein n=1 Tax=Campylobacter corcagiensis TaxID=1448857 RepID=A0A7M1LHQ3_9BACT|nr:hypothetical protein [Campylobacter corcagiensis]QKF63912.1 putative membrane protein [Campylobacter corcagiensis]QOQ87883.1 hypothetical protein IMC76_03525 [Campylobacter corcagiensis]
MINKNQTNLINKRIFLVKIQAVIFLVGMALAMYFSWLKFDYFSYEAVQILAIPIGALAEPIFYKIYVLLLSLIVFCKIFYFTNFYNKKRLFLSYIFNIFPLFIVFLDVNENNLQFANILYFISILIYIISICQIKKFYKLLNEKVLYKEFYFVIFPAISMFIYYKYNLIHSTNYSDNMTEDNPFHIFYVFFALGFVVYLPLSVWLSIPLNLINEYRYFKKS